MISINLFGLILVAILVLILGIESPVPAWAAKTDELRNF
jgi:hypothetical protein